MQSALPCLKHLSSNFPTLVCHRQNIIIRVPLANKMIRTAQADVGTRDRSPVGELNRVINCWYTKEGGVFF